MNFYEHARTIASKASKTINNLSRIMPNLSATRPRRKKLIASVVYSQLLYGSQVWSDKMGLAGWKEMSKVQRKAALRVVLAYRTVSYDAVLVVSGIFPLDIMADERKENYRKRKRGSNNPSTDDLRPTAVESWQRRCCSSEIGRLISEIRDWISRKHGEVNYYLSQALTGHGCFPAYLHKF